MLTNVESLKTLYTKLGGSLTDTYPDIAGGIPVGEYYLISDCILACSEKSSGGGGDTYETVAEIAVGQMVEHGGSYGYQIPQDAQPEVPRRSDALFFNSADYPLTWVENGTTYAYNFSDEGAPLGSPAYAVTLDGGEAAYLITDHDLSNTNVKILKKVSGGSSVTVDAALSDTSENPVQNKVITAALADKMDADEIPEANASNNGKILGVENGAYALVSPSALNDYVVTLTIDPDAQTMTTDNKTVAEINAAIEAGKNVYAELEEEINGVTVMQRFYPTMYCATMVVFGGNLVAAGGSGVELDPVCIVGTHAGNMDTWIAVGN